MHGSDFEAVRALAHGKWGLAIAPEKEALIGNRLRQLARGLGLPNVRAVVEHFRGMKAPRALLPLFDALSTNEISFFRHSEQF